MPITVTPTPIDVPIAKNTVTVLFTTEESKSNEISIGNYLYTTPLTINSAVNCRVLVDNEIVSLPVNVGYYEYQSVVIQPLANNWIVTCYGNGNSGGGSTL